MKNYKYIVPVLLVAGMAAGWYNMIDTVKGNQQKHEEYIRQADDYLKKDIIVDALENYNNALKIEDTLDVRMKIQKVYLDNGQLDEAEEYAVAIMQKYQGNPQIYECMMDYYVKNEMYQEAFSIYDKAAASKAMSSKLKALRASIEYKYTILADAYTKVSSYVNGICAVDYDGEKGYVTESGSKMLFGNYEEITDFMSDFACVKVWKEDDGKKDSKEAQWQLIDTSGNKRRILPENVDQSKIKSVGNYSGGVYAIETDDDKCAYYTADGGLWKDGMVAAGSFWEGKLVVLDGAGYHFIDNQGNQVGGDFEDIVMDDLKVAMRQKRYFAMKGSKYQLYDSEGKVVGNGSWQDADPFTENGAYAAVKSGDKWGFVNTNGDVVIEPQYEDARSFSNGFGAVKKDGKWGFIDQNNKMCIEPTFDDAKYMNSRGNVFIKQNGLWSTLSLYSYNYK